MKNVGLLFIVLMSMQICVSQNKTVTRTRTITYTDEKTPQNITTTVITLNLNTPKKNSVHHSGNEKRLVVDARNPLAFKLINGNPFRYKYVLNYKKVNLFSENTLSFQPPSGTPNKDIDAQASRNLDSVQSIEQQQKEITTLIEQLDTEISKYLDNVSVINEFDFDSFLTKRKVYNDFLKSIVNTNKAIADKIKEDSNATDDQKKTQIEIQKKIEEVTVKVTKLNAVKSNTYLLPIDINGDNIDFVEVQLDVYDGDATVPESYIYKIWIRGGFKIDFSGGAFITSLFDQSFSTTVVTETDAEGNTVNTNRSTITRNDIGDYDFGLGVLVNITYRSNSWIKPALNFGTLVTDRQKFQLLAGGGIIIGKNERWILHGGVSMGRINVLKNNFVADSQTEYVLDAQGNVPTNEKFDFGHFIGVTYNFNKPKG